MLIFNIYQITNVLMSNSNIIKAPGVLKLFGEHAVVYGRKCTAIAIKKYATAKITTYKKNLMLINLEDKKQAFEIDKNLALSIRNLYNKNFNPFFTYSDLIKEYTKLNNSAEKIALNKDLINELCAYGFIVSNFIEKNINVFGLCIKINSNIPERKGLASSASCFVAFASALSKKSSKKLSDKEIIEAARSGEIVIHKNKNAGRIDTAASYFGGLISYKNGSIFKYNIHKIKKLKNVDLIIIDTGPKKTTAKTVAHVANLYNKNKISVEKIFSKIELCSVKGTSALLHGQFKEFGNEMYINQDLLAALNLSTKNLDSAISICKTNNAYGAKLSGGGGGGIAISFIDKKKSKFLIDELNKNNFKAFKSKISEIGAKYFINK